MLIAIDRVVVPSFHGGKYEDATTATKWDMPKFATIFFMSLLDKSLPKTRWNQPPSMNPSIDQPVGQSVCLFVCQNFLPLAIG